MVDYWVKYVILSTSISGRESSCNGQTRFYQSIEYHDISIEIDNHLITFHQLHYFISGSRFIELQRHWWLKNTVISGFYCTLHAQAQVWEWECLRAALQLVSASLILNSRAAAAGCAFQQQPPQPEPGSRSHCRHRPIFIQWITGDIAE